MNPSLLTLKSRRPPAHHVAAGTGRFRQVRVGYAPCVSWTRSKDRSRVLCARYALGETIGAGGAARVYRATDRQLGREVAVKVLDDAAALTADPSARERFLQEARTSARFDHPHLVTVYDAGEDDGALFLVMELVTGHTLAEHIAQHAPLPVSEAVDIARQVLDGLAAAHERRIIHRDVKPSNVLLDATGRARLADFGISKHLDAIERSITSDGMVVGTPSYLAPEQAAGRAPSPATDTYAVGIVLHEMLTGAHPPARTAADAWHARPLDPRRLRPDIPDHIAETVMRATAREPDRRFPSAAAMIRALDGTPTTARRRHGRVAPAAAPSAVDALTTAMPEEPDTELMPPPKTPAPETVALAVPNGRSIAVRRSPRQWAVAGAVAAALVLAGFAVAAGTTGGNDTDVPTTPVPIETTGPATTTTVSPAPQPVAVESSVADPPADNGQDGSDNGKKKGQGKND
jgi:eukaryotic-like serine/threonine-protein kinase